MTRKEADGNGDGKVRQSNFVCEGAGWINIFEGGRQCCNPGLPFQAWCRIVFFIEKQGASSGFGGLSEIVVGEHSRGGGSLRACICGGGAGVSVPAILGKRGCSRNCAAAGRCRGALVKPPFAHGLRAGVSGCPDFIPGLIARTLPWSERFLKSCGFHRGQIPKLR